MWAAKRQKGDYNRRENSLLWFFFVAVLLLAIGCLAGYFWSGHFSGEIQPAIEQLKNIALNIRQNQSVISTLITIFWHNLLAVVFMILLGVFAGIFPAITIWLNGLLMGFVVHMVVTQSHVPAWKVIVYALLPHGIFEVPALLLGSALGIQLGFAAIHSVFRSVMGLFRPDGAASQTRLQGNGPSFRSEFRRAVRWFPVLVGLLIIAATIESAVTPLLIHLSGIAG